MNPTPIPCPLARPRTLALALALALAACGSDPAPATDTTTATDTTVAPDITTAPEEVSACPEGALGCACASGGGNACARGQCVAGVCTLCTRGELQCLCRADSSCEDGVCKDGLCAACPAGTSGCPCADGECAEGSACVSGVCAPDGCAPGSAECPCRQRSAPACDGDLVCLGDATCHACASDRAGCACTDTCSNNLLCDAGFCRAPRSCAVLVAEGFCGEHQRCTENATADAECVADECQDGYVLDRGRCVVGAPNCESDKPGSILAQCTSLMRQCVELDGVADCGPCLDDALDLQGECVGRLSCGEGSCLNSEYCDVSAGTPTCAPLPCPPGEAKDPGGQCRACSFTCSGVGLSGRVWPFRTNTSACICETTRGYFMPPGGDTRAEQCDVDDDGWVREEVRDPAMTSDPALTANARCDLVEVESVHLRDELGIDAEVVSCIEGLLLEPDPTQCSDRIAMPLVESLRNDTPGPLVGTTTPAYGTRRLQAREVNALTKACVSALADYNDDGVEDLLEVQTPPKLLGDDARQRLASFAYFIETHRGYVERAPGEDPYLVIEERYRCDPNDFPLRYDPSVTPSSHPADAYDPDKGATYWRSCTRGADPDYDPDADPPESGFDFAQWSCPDGGLGCNSIAPGPPHGRQDLRVPIAFGSAFPEDATLCELGSRYPADQDWRGLHHASQFKCVGVGDGPGRKPLPEFGEFGDWVMNLCEAESCPPGDASCAESRPVVPGAKSQDPRLSCRAVASVDASDVGFAARRYQPYGIGYGGSYKGGCVSEDTEYHDTLCPEPVFTVTPDDDAFGADTCHIAPCPFGKADCDGDPLNGCELDATNNQDCGGCGVACAPARGVGDCSTGLCRVVSCATGWEDCDDEAQNGCERSIRTLTDCGGCGVPCSVSGGTASCASGVCQVADCAAGLGDCDAADGCETSLKTNDDCGACGVACNPAHAIGTCTTGECEIVQCESGWDDCDGVAANGCEASLTSNFNCGRCGQFCAFFNGTGSCSTGTCLLQSCAAGYGNCNAATPGCQKLNTLTSCGGCNVPCGLPDATATCTTGTCQVTGCNSGHADCDGKDNNGCELNHNTNTSCGSAIDIGGFNGDTKCGAFCGRDTDWDIAASFAGTGEAWYKARIVDDLGICSADLENRVKLIVPDGVSFDLYIWNACGQQILAQDTGGQGEDKTIVFRRPDDGTADHSFNYWIEVRFHDGGSCSEWFLTVEQRNTKC